MFSKRWRLFSLLGIPINVDASWLVILTLVTWTLGNVFAAATPDLPAGVHWLMGLSAALGFFACLVLHELGHAVVAQAVGIPIRGITLFLFGGVAELEGEPKSAKAEFLMASAGPAVTVVLTAAFWLLSGLGWAAPADLVLGYLARINLVVLVFNLLPAFPLDGGRVFRSLLWWATGNLRRATSTASVLGQGFAYLLIGLGVMLILADHFIQGVWLGLIGLFLHNAARAGYQQVVVRQILQGEPVSRFMTREPIVVPIDLDLRSWVEDYVYRYHRKTFPVVSDGHVAGLIGTAALGQYSRDEWGRHTVAEAMRRDVEAVSIAPGDDALTALGKMERTGASRLLVMSEGRLVGILSLKDLLRFLALKIELEDGRG